MYCKCGQPFKTCKCPDIDQRLENLKASPHLLTRWCEACGRHADRCQCAAGPRVVLYSGGAIVSAAPR